ncbi:PadR family transcriptional regulator [Alkaliphilus hydrothermalis]|uniref:DNA-binding PadR family transcriptional regulator n=1 Tax=Alkaliphilus hydrothermalis TaxID=1482730 RepID=A0ABS2NMI9_9FIRM|nr:PadR family transcriptional regulator [Alkaliphilus hydrothermalis]MBM7614165.1 DNA-binding PadR family transcriptional regulator [Alkaliphilus hydrothermalis]
MSLRYGLLGLLCYQDMTGYDLNKAFQSSLQFMWNVKSSQIYRELSKMEDEKLVTSRIETQEKKFDRKVYSITSLGKETFQEWVKKFPQNLIAPIRDEFIVRVFFGEAVGYDNLIFEIQRFKRQQVEALDILSIVEGSATEAARDGGLETSLFYWMLTISRARKAIVAEIEWSEETIELIKNKR